MSLFSIQCSLYEAAEILGPVGSAMIAGFAVIVFGELYLTPEGERYLTQMEPTV